MFYLHGDGLTSTQLVTDENGAQVGRFVYGAWGEELSASESVPGILDNRFVGGLGVRNDSATGLIYMRHRWYEASIQRFISRDPVNYTGLFHAASPVPQRNPYVHFSIVAREPNAYGYAFGNPTRFIDSKGLEGEEVCRDTLCLAKGAVCLRRARVAAGVALGVGSAAAWEVEPEVLILVEELYADMAAQCAFCVTECIAGVDLCAISGITKFLVPLWPGPPLPSI